MAGHAIRPWIQLHPQMTMSPDEWEEVRNPRPPFQPEAEADRGQDDDDGNEEEDEGQDDEEAEEDDEEDEENDEEDEEDDEED